MTLPVSYHQLEWYAEVPRSVRAHKVLGIALFVLALGGFAVWALTAPLAAALIAQGSFVATGKNQIVQHLEGGIIAEITVSEGDRVVAGQPIVRLDMTAANAREQELFLRRARLEAMAARLSAMAADRPAMTLSPFLQNNASNPEVVDILRSQSEAFVVSRRKLELDVTLLQSNLRATELRQIGYVAQRNSLLEMIAVLTEELDGKAELMKAGLTRKDTVNTLRRARIDAEGQLGRIEAQIAENEVILSRTAEQIAQARTAYTSTAMDELQLIEADLDAVREQHVNATAIAERSLILAPVDGIVVQMKYNTPGGVIEPGKPIAEILPADADLIIEAMVQRSDIDLLQMGQTAAVRLVSLNQRTTPVLEGEVFYVSADAVRDKNDPTGRDVYLARVRLPKQELDRVSGFQPMPGMPAEVIVTTHERTFAQYITKPITDSMARAFRED